jgi:hypothetical protein
MRAVLALVFTFAATVAQAQTVSLPKSLVTDAFKQADCEVEINDAIKQLEFAGELSGGLKLVEVLCWRAAYNFGSILFAVNPKEPENARLLRFKTIGEKSKLIDTYQLSSPSYDEKTKLLSSFHKGRGVGDCGSSGQWRWSGTDFTLTRYWNKDKCDGELFDTDEHPAKYLVYPPKQAPQKKK